MMLLIPMLMLSALAQPQPPCAFYGYVYVDGKPAQDGLTIVAVISGATLNWTTQTTSGTYGWPAKGSSLPNGFLIPTDDPDTPEKDGGVTGDAVVFYVQGIKASQIGTFESSGAKRLDLTTFSGTNIVIDQAFVSKHRASVGSVQTVGFHAKWGQNDSDVIHGLLTSNDQQYLTNATGWITFTVTSTTVNQAAWVVNAVNCSGVTVYEQTADIQTISWDRIMIVDGGLTKDSIAKGETVTVWFKAVYEYDNTTFNDGALYVNGSALTWSVTNNRWEYNFTAATLGTESFRITGATDNLYGITAVNDTTGAKTLAVVDQPALTAPILYGILAIIIIATGSATIFLIRRKGYRLKVQKEPSKKPNRNRRMHTPSLKGLQTAL